MTPTKMATKHKPPTPPEIRAARSFLVHNGVPLHAISPRKFAASAKELNKGFRELLKFIARLYSAGQNEALWREEDIHDLNH